MPVRPRPAAGAARRAAAALRLLLALPPVAAATAGPVAAQPAAPAAAAETRHGFAVDRLARIDSALQRAVDAGEIAGAVFVVLRDGRPVHEGAVGWADREAGRRMAPDALFRIASQTKALTSVAAMQLAEEGRLALNDPVSRFIPAFARTTVAVRTDTGRAIVPARRPITIRDLLTQTAGISYGTDSLVAPLYAAAGLGSAAGYGWYTADKSEPICATMERLATLPFVAQPGERWVYGYATDVLGCVVERAAGAPLDAVIRARLTGPLGMRDTHFFVPPTERDRLTAVYTREPAGPAGRLVHRVRDALFSSEPAPAWHPASCRAPSSHGMAVRRACPSLRTRVHQAGWCCCSKAQPLHFFSPGRTVSASDNPRLLRDGRRSGARSNRSFASRTRISLRLDARGTCEDGGARPEY